MHDSLNSEGPSQVSGAISASVIDQEKSDKRDFLDRLPQGSLGIIGRQNDDDFRSYRSAKPFPHIVIPNFLYPDLANQIASDFPLRLETWTRYRHFNEDKYGIREELPPKIEALIAELNGPRFTSFLSELTGISDLIADPMLDGGGLHQSTRGGFLNIHADFAAHHTRPWLRRRVNLLLYLTQEWRDEWGGALELWNRDLTRAVRKIPPIYNSAVIFSTDENSFHGHPEPLACPAGVWRRSLALYYYTEDAAVEARSTDYRPRPQDGALKRGMIWLDRQALRLYDRLRSK